MPAAMGVMKACLSREWILVQRNSFVYIFKAVQVRIGLYTTPLSPLFDERCWCPDISMLV